MRGSVKRKVLYGIFVLLTFSVLGLFVFFVSRYSNRDTNKYDVPKDSLLYTSTYSYTTTKGNAFLSQHADGYYYLSDTFDNNTYVTKIARTAISNNENDDVLYIYGIAYQVDKNGEVTILNGKTEITKDSPSKFYKIDDRKYLFVDRRITSNENTIDTTGYLIIDLDKEGNASFANNKINIKTIKPITIKGSTLSFDIANENLLYQENVIDLTKVIGTTNNFGVSNNSSGNGSNNGNSSQSGEEGSTGSDMSYYDEYLDKVISSVNNLANSVNGVNENVNNSVKKNEVYFDFTKWVALKSVIPSFNSVTINYYVFDPSNEYQAIFLDISSKNDSERRIFLNKTDTSYVLSGLDFDEEYTLSLGYQVVGEDFFEIDDTISFITKIPKVDLEITRVMSNRIYFKLKTNDIKFTSAEIGAFSGGALIRRMDVNVNEAASSDGMVGYFTRENLENNVELRLMNVIFDGREINITASSKMY